MKDNTIKCRYCPEKLPKSYMNDHVAYEHPEQLKKTIKMLKVGLGISITFAAISIGVVWGLMF